MCFTGLYFNPILIEPENSVWLLLVTYLSHHLSLVFVTNLFFCNRFPIHFAQAKGFVL